MASLSYWSQLIPSPRAPSVADSLAARVRDPAWFLARQWQLGEFQGADAGSPAFVRLASHTAPLASAQIGSATATLGGHPLLEPLVEAEPFTPDWSTRVELGQTFEAMLVEAKVAAPLRDRFRAAYPIAPATATTDAATTAFLRVCAGRATDGVALYAAAKAAVDNVPAAPALDSASRGLLQPLLAGFVKSVESTFGDVGIGEPAAWDPTRLSYGVTVTAQSASGGSVTLTGTPDGTDELDWYSFDVAGSSAGAPAPITTSMLPGHVRFRGMPSARWWDFEGSKTDFGAIVPDSRDLAKLLFMDFLLLHGDDWFLAPLLVPTGSLCWIDALTVTDVFGNVRSIAPANDAAWSLFSNRAPAGTAPFLIVPSAASASLATSDPIEELHLLRDETADMAWAVEHIVEGAAGQPQFEGAPAAAVAPTGAPAPLVYRLATPLPSSWFPLLPQQASGAVVLRAGQVEGGAAPQGRILQRLSAPGFQLPDCEVPRAGIRVQRVVCRARAADGSARLWVARRTAIGAGAAASGLRFDVAETTPP